VRAAQPASAVAQQFTGAHQRSEAKSNPLSESDLIALDPTRQEANPTRTRYHTRQGDRLNRFYPLSDFLNLHEIEFDSN
jgi:hypothetical protein